MSQTTRHGENIADEIQTEDAYGYYNPLTDADVYTILDNLHTHIMDTRWRADKIFDVLEQAMREIESFDEDVPA